MSPDVWRAWTIPGKMEAKKQAPVTAAKLRTILSLPALIGALDAILAHRLNEIADKISSQLGFGYL